MFPPLDANKLLQIMEAQYGFKQMFFTKGTGLSIFNSEDPYLARIMVSKD